MKLKFLGAVIGSSLLLGLTSTANAGLCTDHITTTWRAGGVVTVMNTTSDTSLTACSSTSTFSGESSDNTGSFDRFNYSVSVINDHTIGLNYSWTAAPNNGRANGPDFRLTLGDIDWVGMTGEIVDVVGHSFGISVEFTADTITFSNLLGFFGRTNPGGTFSHSGTFQVVARHISEPGTLTLIVLGVAGLALARRQAA